jgi:hypothetical protein
MRAFWEQESDQLVAKVLGEMLDSYEANCELNGHDVDTAILSRSRDIVSRLSGKASASEATDETNFLEKELTIPSIHKLPVESQVATIIEARLIEARTALKVRAYLSVIFLCGSVLEGVLLGAALKNPEKINRSAVSPEDVRGKVKPLHEWTLA